MNEDTEFQRSYIADTLQGCEGESPVIGGINIEVVMVFILADLVYEVLRGLTPGGNKLIGCLQTFGMQIYPDKLTHLK